MSVGSADLPPHAYRSIQYSPPLSFFTYRTIFVVALRIFTVEQFEVQRWKANENMNLRKKTN